MNLSPHPRKSARLSSSSSFQPTQQTNLSPQKPQTSAYLKKEVGMGLPPLSRRTCCARKGTQDIGQIKLLRSGRLDRPQIIVAAAGIRALRNELAPVVPYRIPFHFARGRCSSLSVWG